MTFVFITYRLCFFGSTQWRSVNTINFVIQTTSVTEIVTSTVSAPERGHACATIHALFDIYLCGLGTVAFFHGHVRPGLIRPVRVRYGAVWLRDVYSGRRRIGGVFRISDCYVGVRDAVRIRTVLIYQGHLVTLLTEVVFLKQKR